MAKLLYIEASPRKDRSHSIVVAREFVKAYQESHHADQVESLDLWSLKLPEFDGETINAKYAILHGQGHTPQQKAAWEAVAGTFNRFKQADKYLFSVPMWNFGIPYKLKHWIDVIVQPGLAFSFSPQEGYKGLVTGKPAAIVYASGGEYTSSAAAKSYDFQRSYFEHFLRFIGFTSLQSILIEPTLSDPESVKKTVAAAKEQARKIAAAF